MNIEDMQKKYKKKLRIILQTKTGCSIQYAGFPCGTCFFNLKKKNKLENQDWQLVLLIRGDTNKKDLHNLPPKEEWETRIKNILECKK